MDTNPLRMAAGRVASAVRWGNEDQIKEAKRKLAEARLTAAVLDALRDEYAPSMECRVNLAEILDPERSDLL